MSRQNTPPRIPVPSALAQASLAAKRLAKLAAASFFRKDRSRSTGVKIRSMKRSPKRSSVAWMRRMSDRSEPIADDHAATSLGDLARGVHQLAHPRDGGREADENRFTDQEVADVELAETGNGGDGADGLVVDAVSGVDLQAEFHGVAGGVPQRVRKRSFALEAPSRAAVQ